MRVSMDDKLEVFRDRPQRGVVEEDRFAVHFLEPGAVEHGPAFPFTIEAREVSDPGVARSPNSVFARHTSPYLRERALRLPVRILMSAFRPHCEDRDQEGTRYPHGGRLPARVGERHRVELASSTTLPRIVWFEHETSPNSCHIPDATL